MDSIKTEGLHSTPSDPEPVARHSIRITQELYQQFLSRAPSKLPFADNQPTLEKRDGIASSSLKHPRFASSKISKFPNSPIFKPKDSIRPFAGKKSQEFDRNDTASDSPILHHREKAADAAPFPKDIGPFNNVASSEVPPSPTSPLAVLGNNFDSKSQHQSPSSGLGESDIICKSTNHLTSLNDRITAVQPSSSPSESSLLNRQEILNQFKVIENELDKMGKEEATVLQKIITIQEDIANHYNNLSKSNKLDNLCPVTCIQEEKDLYECLNEKSPWHCRALMQYFNECSANFDKKNSSYL